MTSLAPASSRVPKIIPGAFVWCNFPTSTAPMVPGLRHLVYVVAAPEEDGEVVSLVAAYTSSQPLPAGPIPSGVKVYSREEAEQLGQGRGFYLDFRRMAHMPLDQSFFPDLNAPEMGMVGRATKRMRDTLEAELLLFARRQGALIEKRGPLRF